MLFALLFYHIQITLVLYYKAQLACRLYANVYHKVLGRTSTVPTFPQMLLCSEANGKHLARFIHFSDPFLYMISTGTYAPC